MNYLGIDPGLSGGLAILDEHGGVVDAADIPLTGVGPKRRVDARALQRWIADHKPRHAFVERAQAMPRQGVSSSFNYGRGVGYLEATVACCGIPLTIVEPSMWKKHFGLKGPDKEQARQRAIQLHPDAAELFARKKDHGRAEAALIAAYGAAKLGVQ